MLTRPKPLNDELLISWLARLANSNHVTLRELGRLLVGHAQKVLGSDVDRSIGPALIQRLASIARIDEHTIQRTTLRSYEGFLFERHSPVGQSRWTMPIGKYGNRRLGFGQQYCPRCLATDRKPYLRRHWRLALSVFCLCHRRYLRDSCPHCQSPVALPVDSQAAVGECAICHGDLTKDPKPIHRENIDDASLDHQQRLYCILESGWANLPRGRVIYAHLYFEGLHSIWRMLAGGGYGERLYKYLCQERGELALPLPFPKNCGAIEMLRLPERANLLSLSAGLFRDWPKNAQAAFKAAKVGCTDIADRRGRTPFWLAEDLRQSLYSRPYWKSQGERIAAAQYLRSHGQSDSRNNVARWLGAWHVLKNKDQRSTVVELARRSPDLG